MKCCLNTTTTTMPKPALGPTEPAVQLMPGTTRIGSERSCRKVKLITHLHLLTRLMRVGYLHVPYTLKRRGCDA